MNTNMNVTIRRLTNTFILFFLILSGVAAYIQVSNHAFYNGPTLADNTTYDPRICPPFDAPLRGRILDRNGQVIAQTVKDDAKSGSYTCGYHRVYAQWVIDDGLAPLIGYFTYGRGAAGVEASYNDQLAGINQQVTSQQAMNKLLHKPQYGNDVYLTIDKRIQDAAAKYYDSAAIQGGGVCESQPNPPGSLIVEDPRTGEILSMVSHPDYDPNQIVAGDSLNQTAQKKANAYWAQINTASTPVLINRATQGQYTPGSDFKTLTLIAALDTGQASLTATQFTQEDAMSVNAGGFVINWDDYNAIWKNYSRVTFPEDVQDAYAFSNNVVFARLGLQLGADKWLSYLGKFGINTQSHSWTRVPFDAPAATSIAYPATQNGKPYNFDDAVLGNSAFGQGPLLITPLTMATVTSTIAADGVLRVPHVGYEVVANGATEASGIPVRDVSTDQQVIQPGTAQAVRTAMWSVVDYGTAFYGLGQQNGHLPRDSGNYMGGKTGTAQTDKPNPHAWWISMAPDDQAPGASGPAKGVIVVMKEYGGEGACQVYVADDLYSTISHNNWWPTT